MNTPDERITVYVSAEPDVFFTGKIREMAPARSVLRTNLRKTAFCESTYCRETMMSIVREYELLSRGLTVASPDLEINAYVALRDVQNTDKTLALLEFIRGSSAIEHTWHTAKDKKEYLVLDVTGLDDLVHLSSIVLLLEEQFELPSSDGLNIYTWRNKCVSAIENGLVEHAKTFMSSYESRMMFYSLLHVLDVYLNGESNTHGESSGAVSWYEGECISLIKLRTLVEHFNDKPEIKEAIISPIRGHRYFQQFDDYNVIKAVFGE